MRQHLRCRAFRGGEARRGARLARDGALTIGLDRKRVSAAAGEGVIDFVNFFCVSPSAIDLFFKSNPRARGKCGSL